MNEKSAKRITICFLVLIIFNIAMTVAQCFFGSFERFMYNITIVLMWLLIFIYWRYSVDRERHFNDLIDSVCKSNEARRKSDRHIISNCNACIEALMKENRQLKAKLNEKDNVQ
jgi:c-di-AMP phosphodiesterase-like protein